MASSKSSLNFLKFLLIFRNSSALASSITKRETGMGVIKSLMNKGRLRQREILGGMFENYTNAFMSLDFETKSDIITQQVEAAMSFLLALQCQHVTGNGEAYKTLKAQPEEFKKCIVEQISENQVKNAVKLARESDFDALHTLSCGVSSTIRNCAYKFAEGIDICLNDFGRDLVKLSKTLQPLKDFTCSKTITELSKIKDAENDECYQSKRDEAEKCLSDTVLEYIDNSDTRENVAGLLNLLNDEDECTNLTKFEECVMPLYDDCDNKEPAEIIGGLIKGFIASSACKQE